MNKDNDGQLILNGHAVANAAKTVIVLGAPRGGTSMVAGTLSKLGVYMGRPDKLAPFYENAELGECAKAHDRARARTTIAALDQAHSMWGLKVLPKSWRFWLWRPMFTRPAYVVVLRDPLAVAKRRATSMDKTLLAAQIKAGGSQVPQALAADARLLRSQVLWASLFNLRLLAFLYLCRQPVLAVSYEKALLQPEGFVQGLAAFIGLADTSRVAEAVAFVKPSPREYVMRSTTHAQLDSAGRHFGYVDRVEAGAVTGWALSLDDAQPLTLELRINGALVQTLPADQPRPDVRQTDARFRDDCGFTARLSSGEALRPGDRVEVIVSGLGLHLINSPHTVAA